MSNSSTDRVRTEVLGPQVGVVAGHRSHHPVPQAMGGGVPRPQRQPYRHRDPGPVQGQASVAVPQGLHQQQHHRAGFPSTRSADQHQPAVPQTGIDLIMQPGHQPRIQNMTPARPGGRTGSGSGSELRAGAEASSCWGKAMSSPAHRQRTRTGAGASIPRRTSSFDQVAEIRTANRSAAASTWAEGRHRFVRRRRLRAQTTTGATAPTIPTTDGAIAVRLEQFPRNKE